MEFFRVDYANGGQANVNPNKIMYMRYFPGKTYSDDAGQGTIFIQLEDKEKLVVFDCSTRSYEKYVRRWQGTLEDKDYVEDNTSNPLDDICKL